MTNTKHSAPNHSSLKPRKGLHRGLGLWRLSYFWRAVSKEGAQYGYPAMALKHLGYLQMLRAPERLKPFTEKKPGVTLEVHFLTGVKHIHQTCFCAYSIMHHATANIRPVIHDDGTLDEEHVAKIKRIFPDARVMLNREAEDLLEDYLPQHKFPHLRSQRLTFPLMRKLTDVHATVPGRKLFLDSDMVFYRDPEYLLNWLRSAQEPCYMKDVQNAYGYSEQLLLSLLNTPMPQMVNTGICGMDREAVDWEQLEVWCKALTEREGVNHFLEQALTAMMFSRQSTSVVPEKDYIVWPDRDESRQPQAVMHHYVDESRHWYYTYGWKHVLRYAQ